jgi:hypothetical protein
LPADLAWRALREREAGFGVSGRDRPSRIYAGLQMAGWTLYGVIGVVITAMFSTLTPGLAVTTLFGAALGGTGTHLLRGWAVGRGWFALPIRALLARLGAAALVVAFAIELGVWGFGLFIARVYTLEGSTPAVMIVTTFNWIIIVVLWVAVYASIRFFRDYRAAEIRRLKSEVAAREAQLGALTAQIHPHFLFNALNALRALVIEDPARARELITELAEILRYALHAGRRERVTLAEELDIVRAYLRLESARFEDRLRWTIDVPETIGDTLLPPMLLQTLVENAVRHGIGSLPAGGEVTVAGRAENGEVHLRVTNPGRFRGPREGGVGLPNAHERLRIFYGGRARLAVAQAGDRVEAELSWPLERPS